MNRYTATTALGFLMLCAGGYGIGAMEWFQIQSEATEFGSFILSVPVVIPVALIVVGAFVFFFSPSKPEPGETYKV